MAELDKETKQKRLKITKIVWIVFGIVALLAILFLPGIIQNNRNQDRESPTSPSYDLDEVY